MSASCGCFEAAPSAAEPTLVAFDTLPQVTTDDEGTRVTDAAGYTHWLFDDDATESLRARGLAYLALARWREQQVEAQVQALADLMLSVNDDGPFSDLARRLVERGVRVEVRDVAR